MTSVINEQDMLELTDMFDNVDITPEVLEEKINNIEKNNTFSEFEKWGVDVDFGDLNDLDTHDNIYGMNENHFPNYESDSGPNYESAYEDSKLELTEKIDNLSSEVETLNYSMCNLGTSIATLTEAINLLNHNISIRSGRPDM